MWTLTQSDIYLTGGVWASQTEYLQLNTTDSTSTKLCFDHNGYGASHGIVFVWTGTDITLHCNDNTNGNNDNDPPVSASVSGGTAVATLTGLQVGNTISLHGTGTSSNIGSFNIPSFNLASGGSGPGTLSTADSASFAGTTLQQIQWTIKNGTSPTPNSNYYLFNESPGGTALDTLNIGPNPTPGAESTSSYIDTSGADFTGIWYVGYGSNSTRVNLATYNFSRASTRKVFCNFW